MSNDLYTIRGKVGHEEIKRIQLFDGKFTTAYKVVSISTMPATFSATADCSIILATTESINLNPDFSDNTQIGWASLAFDVNYGSSGSVSIIDPDNLIVEDLYIAGFNNDSSKETNYMVTLEKYDITDWKGALTMVRNRSQT